MRKFAETNLKNQMKKTLTFLAFWLLICTENAIHAAGCTDNPVNTLVRVRIKTPSSPERSGTYYIIYAELDSEEARLVIPLPDDFGEASIRIVRCADEAVMQTCTADAAAGKVTLRVDYAPGSYRIELESDAYTGEGHFTLP